MSEAPEVTTISAGIVNCYLLRSGERFVLIDSATRGQRAVVERAIEDAGCSAGDLALIVATHGDPDHIGNCAYLRDKLGGKIGMHRLEAPTAETGDTSKARPHLTGLSKPLFALVGLFFGLRTSDYFTPDVLLENGDDLSEYGLDATVVALPGHSAGSIGVLTAAGDLYCGDLMTNTKQPAANTLADSGKQIRQSIERVRRLGAVTVYPGHGTAFAMADFLRQDGAAE